MYQKKRTPYGAFFVLLIIMLALAYFLSGLFQIPGASLINIEENMIYVFQHPLSNWNEKTMPCMGVAFIVWIFMLNYITYYRRNFYLDKEHGSAHWRDVREACKKLADEEDRYNRIISENLRISTRGSLSNNNMLIIGSSGSYKTTAVLHQNLLQFGSCYVVLDVKGDTQRKLGKDFLKAGYTIKSLNFKNPEKSDRINPFVYIEMEDDLLRIIKSLHDAVRPPEKGSNADPFWDDAVDLYLNSVFSLSWLLAREKGEYGSMNEVMMYTNMETRKKFDPETEEEVTELQELIDELAYKYGEDYPPVRDYRKLKGGAPDTVNSVILMVNGMLKHLETAEVKRIFSANDIDIRELGTGVGGDHNKKIVLFIVTPDNNPVYNPFISMFYTQCFDILIRLSDDELKAPLPVAVEFWLDEFYAGAKPAGADVLLGVIRSRNISMIPMLQSVSQIKTLFKDDKWETIMDNVSVVLYLGSGPLAASTHKFISEALSKATIDSQSDNVHFGSNGNNGINFSRMGRELMTPNEVREMPTTDAIIFLEGSAPMYDTKAIPFDVKKKGFRADKYLKKRYQNALALGEYEHPVYTIYDPVHFKYITVKQEQSLQMITDAEEIQTYQEAAKHDPDIYVYNIEEQDLLYLSWGKQELKQEEIEDLFRMATEQEEKRNRDMQGLLVLQNVENAVVPDFGTTKHITNKEEWNQDTLRNMLNQHWNDLSAEEQEEIYLAMDDGLTEEQLCHLMLQPLEQMAVWRRAYLLENRNR